MKIKQTMDLTQWVGKPNPVLDFSNNFDQTDPLSRQLCEHLVNSIDVSKQLLIYTKMFYPITSHIYVHVIEYPTKDIQR